MKRRFNTAGPCRPDWHYMLPPEARLPQARRLIEEGQYFVLHAPRQSGKTTLFLGLAKALNREGRFAAVYATCETAQAAGDDAEGAVAAVLRSLEARARELPEDSRPAPVDDFKSIEPIERLRYWLAEWSRLAARPVVLFLDEVDALLGAGLITVLRQLRAGFVERPERFPHSVALIGLRAVRDLFISAVTSAEHVANSPLDIFAESLILPNFTEEEVSQLFSQYTVSTGQAFTASAVQRAYSLTGGKPRLVSSLARQLVEEVVLDLHGPIRKADIEVAKEVLPRHDKREADLQRC